MSPFWADVDTRMTDDSQCDVIRNAVYLKEYVKGPEEDAAILQSISAIVGNSSAYQMNTQRPVPGQHMSHSGLLLCHGYKLAITILTVTRYQ